jgi:RHS repeat-associated protein
MPDGIDIANVYDVDGWRVQQTVGSQTTNYLWDELSPYGDVVLETNNSGSILASYTLAGAELISQTRSGATNYYLHDGQGSVRAMANASGNLTNIYAYTAFGEMYSQTGSTTNNYLYTGQQFDSSSGLYNLRARYYNPGNGRFLSRDTIGYNIGNPIELNRYGYTANNPVNATDPTGNQAFAEYVTNSFKGAGFGATINFVSDIAIQVFFEDVDRIDWTRAWLSAVAGAAAGMAGGIIGTGGIALLGKGFAAIVLTGMAGGWASGLAARGTLNHLEGKDFLDGYTPQAAITDAVVGGLTAGFFRQLQAIRSRGLPPAKFFTPEELKQYNALKARFPEWMPPDDFKIKVRSSAETAEVRAQVNNPGHHREPLKFGGDPNPMDGLQPTGETRTNKNPIHTLVTSFWNEIMRARR